VQRHLEHHVTINAAVESPSVTVANARLTRGDDKIAWYENRRAKSSGFGGTETDDPTKIP
jgi:hypothetical protein